MADLGWYCWLACNPETGALVQSESIHLNWERGVLMQHASL